MPAGISHTRCLVRNESNSFLVTISAVFMKIKSQTIEIEPTSHWEEQTWYNVHFSDLAIFAIVMLSAEH